MGLAAPGPVGSSWTRDQTHLLHWQVGLSPPSHHGGPGTVLELKTLSGGRIISQGPGAALRPLLGQPVQVLRKVTARIPRDPLGIAVAG